MYTDRFTTEFSDLCTDLRTVLSDVTDVIRTQNEVINAEIASFLDVLKTTRRRLNDVETEVVSNDVRFDKRLLIQERDMDHRIRGETTIKTKLTVEINDLQEAQRTLNKQVTESFQRLTSLKTEDSTSVFQA